jgi:hypothetical protein
MNNYFIEVLDINWKKQRYLDKLIENIDLSIAFDNKVLLIKELNTQYVIVIMTNGQVI